MHGRSAEGLTGGKGERGFIIIEPGRKEVGFSQKETGERGEKNDVRGSSKKTMAPERSDGSNHKRMGGKGILKKPWERKKREILRRPKTEG